MTESIRWFSRCLLVLTAVAIACPAPAHDAPATAPDDEAISTIAPALFPATRSTPVKVTTRDGRRLIGTVLAYDLEGFVLEKDGQPPQVVPWADLSATNVVVVFGGFMQADSAQENFRLATILSRLEDGADLAHRIFRNTVRLDPSYQDQFHSLRIAGDAPAVNPPLPSEPDTPVTQPPRIRASDYTWQTLSEEEIAAFVAREKEFVASVLDYLQVEMRLIETEHYLFYTDAEPREVTRMSILLENMYRRLSQMLDIPPQVNIWKGKALIFLCSEEELYHRIERDIFKNPNSRGTAGVCHSFATGEVRIVFTMMQDRWNLQHLLVHETTHGFLHRYRSARPIPNWLNEGIAEYLATRLVVQSDFNRYRRSQGMQELAKRGSFEGALHARNIPFWFYGVSLHLVEMLMQKDREAVFAMLRDIKDGVHWEQSLLDRFNLTPQGLADELQKYLRLKEPITLE